LPALRKQKETDKRLFLICDVHASYRTAEVKPLAVTLNIELIDIPPETTDKQQPLGRKAFGALKAGARRLFRQRVAANPELALARQEETQSIHAWDQLSPATLASAWRIDQEDEEWGLLGED
jgi:hypothetical protein